MQVAVRNLEYVRTRSRSPEARYGRSSAPLVHNEDMSVPRRIIRTSFDSQHGYMKWHDDEVLGHGSGVSSNSRLYSSLSSKHSKFLERNNTPANASKSRFVEYDNANSTNYEWNEMLTFRTFVIMRTQEETTPLEAIKAYDEYKRKFYTEREPRFLWLIKDFPVIMERYNPEMLRLEFDEAKERCKVEASHFVKMLAEERFIGLSFVEQSSTLRSVADIAWPFRVMVGKLFEKPTVNPLSPPFWIPVDPDLNCLCIRKFPVHISKWDLKNYVTAQTGEDTLMDVTVTEPNDFHLTLRGGYPFRRAWIRYISDEACGTAELKLERATLKNTKLHPLRRIPNVRGYVFRVTPSEAAHPARILRDLVLSAHLILKLDYDFGVTELLGGNISETCSFEARCLEHPVLSELNHVFNGLSRSTEEQLDLQLLYLRVVHSTCYYSGRRFNSPRHLWETAEVLYVRPRVDLTEVIEQFKNFESCNEDGWDRDYIEARDFFVTDGLLTAALGPFFCEGESSYFEPKFMDAPETIKGMTDNKQHIEDVLAHDFGDISYKTKNETQTMEDAVAVKMEQIDRNEIKMIQRGRNSEWLRILDNRIARLLTEDIQKSVTPITEDSPFVQERWSALCDKVIEEIALEKWRCGLCSKMFRGVEFVKKHLKNKHSKHLHDIVVEIRNRVTIQNYQSDPFRLPIAQPVVTPYVYRRGLPSYQYESSNLDSAQPNYATTPASIEEASEPKLTMGRQGFNHQYRDLDAPRPLNSSGIKNLRETISYNDL